MTTTARRDPPYRTRRSRIHGTGAFASRPIRKGQRIDEYVGEHISHEEADRRHSQKEENDSHTFLFTLDKKTVVDATDGGNDSRFINHSCEPNCEVTIEDGRIFIYALKALKPGDELLYDYNIGRSDEDPENQEQIFACRCGAKTCRGTMLEPKKSAAKKRAAAKKAAKKAARKGSTKKVASPKNASVKKSASPKKGSAKKSASPKKAASKKKASPKKAKRTS